MRSLTFEEIQKNTVGAAFLEACADGIHFHKCTALQEQAWDRHSKSLGENARKTTGVRIEFYTDSETLRFAARGGKFELWINGVLSAQFFMGADQKNGELAEYKLGIGMKRVLLAFPSHTVGVLSSLWLDDGSTLLPVSFSRKLLMLGDSITQGWDSVFDTLSYAWRTAMFFDADCIIQGIGGAIFAEDTFDPQLPYDPDLVLVAYGTNDFGHYQTMDEIRTHANAYLKAVKARYGDRKIVVITPIWRADLETPRAVGTFEEVLEAVRGAAEQNGCMIVDGMKLTPHLPEVFADAYLHPNDVGFGVYAENLIRELIPLLK